MGDNSLALDAEHDENLPASGPAMRVVRVVKRVSNPKRACQISVSSHSVDSDTGSGLQFQAGARVKSRCEDHFVRTAHDQLYAKGETIKSIGTSPASQNTLFTKDTRAHVADYNAGRR
jgi:hypothetical protein